MHKLRRAMVRPGRDRLSGIVEVDEAYRGGEKEAVHGRQTSDKALIAVAAEADGTKVEGINGHQGGPKVSVFPAFHKGYALRWKIEVFHEMLKSGCRVEESRLRTAERLVRLVAVCCILSWRIFRMTMIHRTHPEAAPAIALTRPELDLLDRLFPVSR